MQSEPDVTSEQFYIDTLIVERDYWQKQAVIRGWGRDVPKKKAETPVKESRPWPEGKCRECELFDFGHNACRC